MNRQFDLYRPNITICCGHIVSRLYYQIRSVEDKPTPKKTTRGVWYHLWPTGECVICYHHPVAWMGDSLLYYGLMDAVKEITCENSRAEVAAAEDRRD